MYYKLVMLQKTNARLETGKLRGKIPTCLPIKTRTVFCSCLLLNPVKGFPLMMLCSNKTECVVVIGKVKMKVKLK